MTTRTSSRTSAAVASNGGSVPRKSRSELERELGAFRLESEERGRRITELQGELKSVTARRDSLDRALTDHTRIGVALQKERDELRTINQALAEEIERRKASGEFLLRSMSALNDNGTTVTHPM